MRYTKYLVGILFTLSFFTLAISALAATEMIGIGGVEIGEVNHDEETVDLAYYGVFADLNNDFVNWSTMEWTNSCVAVLCLEGEDYDGVAADAMALLVEIMGLTAGLDDFSAIIGPEDFEWSNITLGDPAPPGTFIRIMEAGPYEFTAEADMNYILVSVIFNFTDTYGDFEHCEVLGIALPFGIRNEVLQEIVEVEVDETPKVTETIDLMREWILCNWIYILIGVFAVLAIIAFARWGDK